MDAIEWLKENYDNSMFLDSHNRYEYNNKAYIKMGLIMINKLDFKAKNTTSKIGIFSPIEEANSNDIFDIIEN